MYDHTKPVNDHSENELKCCDDQKHILLPYISTKHHMITKSYFCFECGAILTTKEDKKQHDEWELHKKTTEPKDEP